MSADGDADGRLLRVPKLAKQRQVRNSDLLRYRFDLLAHPFELRTRLRDSRGSQRNHRPLLEFDEDGVARLRAIRVQQSADQTLVDLILLELVQHEAFAVGETILRRFIEARLQNLRVEALRGIGEEPRQILKRELSRFVVERDRRRRRGRLARRFGRRARARLGCERGRGGVVRLGKGAQRAGPGEIVGMEGVQAMLRRLDAIAELMVVLLD